MLKQFRKDEFKKKILWFVTIIIILSFGVFGTAYIINGNNSSRPAGKIFGKTVPYSKFEEAYQENVIQAKIRYGNQFNSILPYLNLTAEAWDRIILINEADKQKITVSDEDVIKAIESYPFFQRDGKFDSKLYESIIEFAFQSTAVEFERTVRSSLKITKLFEKETEFITVKEEELYNLYKNRNEQVQVSYVFISPDRFKNEANFNETEAEKYYESHKLDLIEPTSISVQYISLDFPEAQEGEEPFDKTALRQKASDLYKEALQTGNLKETAGKNGLELKTTDYFSMEKPNLSLGWSYELINQLFTLDKNQLSQPMETDKRIILAQLTDKRESFIPTYDEAKEKIKDIILIEEAKKVARAKADEYLTGLKDEIQRTKLEDFADAAKALELEIHQTPVFNRGQYLPQVGLSKNFQDTAFQLNKNQKLSGVVETDKGFCILHLDSYIPVDMDKFNEEKEDIKQNVLAKQKSEAFNEYLSQLKIDAKLEDNISKMQEQAKSAGQL